MSNNADKITSLKIHHLTSVIAVFSSVLRNNRVAFLCGPIGAATPAIKRNESSQSASGNSSAQTASPMGGTPKRRVLVTKAGALQAQPVVVRQTSNAQSKLPDSAPIIGTVFRYSDDGSIWAQNHPSGQAMYEIVLHHRQRKPSVTWNILEKFHAYIHRQAGGDDALPMTLRELNDSWHVRLVLKPRSDPDETFDSSVVAFYCTGDQDEVDNMLIILDNYSNDCATSPEPGLVSASL